MLFQKTTNLPCGRRVCVLFISLLTTFLFSSCKSDCEKAAEFSATDYETASSAMDHKLIIDMKCKAEIDKLGLDKKEAAQKYCDYTKNCSEINEILRTEEKEKAEAEARKAEEERQAKIAELKSQVENNCPNEKNKLNKDLNNEQRQNCWNSKKAYMEFSGDKERSHYYWSLGSSVLGFAKAKYFRKSEPTGVIITATRYIYIDKGLLVCIDVMNQSIIVDSINETTVMKHIRLLL